jgi:hypothetical protein
MKRVFSGLARLTALSLILVMGNSTYAGKKENKMTLDKHLTHYHDIDKDGTPDTYHKYIRYRGNNFAIFYEEAFKCDSNGEKEEFPFIKSETYVSETKKRKKTKLERQFRVEYDSGLIKLDNEDQLPENYNEYHPDGNSDLIVIEEADIESLQDFIEYTNSIFFMMDSLNKLKSNIKDLEDLSNRNQEKIEKLLKEYERLDKQKRKFKYSGPTIIT